MRFVAEPSNALLDMLARDQENGVNPVEVLPPPGPPVDRRSHHGDDD